MLRTGESHDPKGRLSSRFDAGLSTDAGDQLPGSLVTTRTGLAPAGNDELPTESDHVITPPLSNCRAYSQSSWNLRWRSLA